MDKEQIVRDAWDRHLGDVAPETNEEIREEAYIIGTDALHNAGVPDNDLVQRMIDESWPEEE